MSDIQDFQTLKTDLNRRMQSAIEVLKKEFTGLRTGRASTSLLDPIMVDAYGSPTPLNQIASISVPEARLITVNIWDKSMVQAVEKAIRESDLGLNPASEGQLLRIPLPPLNEERRTELTKVANKYAEQARIAIRNVRSDGRDTLKKMEKDKHISEDEHHNHEDEIQKITDDAIKEVDHTLEIKSKEIMQV